MILFKNGKNSTYAKGKPTNLDEAGYVRSELYDGIEILHSLLRVQGHLQLLPHHGLL